MPVMTRGVTTLLLSIAAAAAALTGPTALCAPSGDANCLMCHSAAGISKASTTDLRKSVHSGLKCVQCHADLQDRPQMHAGTAAPVECARCHQQKGGHYDAVHAAVGRGSKPPTCAECHGSHGVMPARDALSSVNRANATGTCATCHAGVKSLGKYRFSVHGTIEKEGALPAAVCTDCHRVHRSSTLGMTADCMQCHARQASEYLASAHGAARVSGDLHAPSCEDCHGGHEADSISNPDARMSPLREPRQCGRCHDNSELMAGYGLPVNRLKTYRHSYHGKANLHGDTDSATCSDCHSAHKVLPSTDSASPTNEKNLHKTCAACHPGVSPNVAKGKVHVEITKADSPLLYYVANGFKWLTIGTMVMLCGHIGLDLFSRGRKRLVDALRRRR